MSKICIYGIVVQFSIFSLVFAADGNAQNKSVQEIKISLNMTSPANLDRVLKSVEESTDFHFSYIDQQLKKSANSVNVTVDKVTLGDLLMDISKQTDFTFRRVNDNIFIAQKEPGVEPVVEVIKVNVVVTGEVTDENGDALPGATVVEKGTSNGTVTDVNGRFSLDVNEGATLIISFVGYGSQEVAVGNQSSINVQLTVDQEQLEEVVVVAYGTQSKRDLTGAVQTVKADDLSSLPVGQFAQKLQGQVAGVQISQTTGQPGQGMLFRIRGAASINAGNQPLIVVDGFPMVGGINNLNPDDIESYTVLKDAAATSLYGSRAGNGVVLITTKRGRQGQSSIDVNIYQGVQVVPDRGRPDLMNGREFAQYQKEHFEDKIAYEGWTNADGQPIVPEVYQNPDQYGKGTDWYDVMLRQAKVENYSISATTSRDNFVSSTVGTYFNQKGVLRNTGFKRFAFRNNSEYKVNDRIKVGFNLAPSYQISENQNTDGFREIIGTAVTVSPLLSPRDENGDLVLVLSAPNMFDQPNWYRVLTEQTNIQNRLHLLTNSYVELSLLEGLKYKIQAGVELANQNQRTFTPSTAGGSLGSAPPQPAVGSYNSSLYYSWTLENIVTYEKSIQDHNFQILGGYTAQKYVMEGSNLNATDYPDDEIEWPDAAASITGGGNTTEWALLSYIGRLDYNFAHRYFLQGSIRRDGSSRFGADNKWAVFPSISAGWMISEESFFKGLSTPINYLKLRASYGVTGNNNIGNYAHIASVGTANYTFGGNLEAGKALTTLGNSELTWEETSQMDIGLEAGFFNDRFFVKYDYYKKSTDNLLYQLDIPLASGFASVPYNVGKIDFWGHEVSFETQNTLGNVQWNANVNVAFNRNEVKQLGTEDAPVGGYDNAGDINRLEVGQPVGIFMGYVNDGVYMTQAEFDSQPKHASSDVGTARMKDIDGDGDIDQDDRTIIGDPNPDMIFGFTNQFNWKNVDVSIVMSGVIGGDIIARSYESTENLDGVFNVNREVANRWRSLDNPGNGKIPRTKAGTTELFRYNNTRWVSDGTHLAIKNVTVGYTFKLDKVLSKARIYFSGQQLAILTKYKGGNPEVSSGLNWNGLGVDNTAYPVPRTYTVGCNLTIK